MCMEGLYMNYILLKLQHKFMREKHGSNNLEIENLPTSNREKAEEEEAVKQKWLTKNIVFMHVNTTFQFSTYPKKHKTHHSQIRRVLALVHGFEWPWPLEVRPVVTSRPQFPCRGCIEETGHLVLRQFPSFFDDAQLLGLGQVELPGREVFPLKCHLVMLLSGSLLPVRHSYSVQHCMSRPL